MTITEALEKALPDKDDGSKRVCRPDVDFYVLVKKYDSITNGGHPIFVDKKTKMAISGLCLTIGMVKADDWEPYDVNTVKCKACEEADSLFDIYSETGDDIFASKLLKDHLKKYHCTCKGEKR